MPLPTPFFTHYVYAMHVVTHVTAPFSRGEREATISFACPCEADERRTKDERQLFTEQDSGQLEAVEWGRTPRVGQTHAQRRRADQRRCHGAGWQDPGTLWRDGSGSQQADRTMGQQVPYTSNGAIEKEHAGELA